MHTYTYRVRGYSEVNVIVNGDWSGDAIVNWTKDGKFEEIVIPGRILQGIAKVLGREIMQEGLEKFLSSLEEDSS